MLRGARRTGSKGWVGVWLVSLALIHSMIGVAHATEAETGSSNGIGGRLTLRLAPEFSSGDYGDDGKTDIGYVRLSARYESDGLRLTPYAYDRVSLKLTLSYVDIDGPAGVVSGTGGPVVVRGRGQGAGSGSGTTTLSLRSHERGLGDILIMASYHVLPPPKSKRPWLTLSGKIKIPTASESRNLGTGEADYTLFSELYQPIARFGIYLGGGYRFMGDPDGLRLDDRWIASAGADVQLSSIVSAGLGYAFRDAVVSSTSDAHELTPWIGFRVGGGFRIEPYAVVGLSNGSPDYGIGALVSWSLRPGIRGSTSRRPSRSP